MIVSFPSDSLTKLYSYQDSTSARKPVIDSIYRLKAQKQNDYVLLASYAATDSSYSYTQLMDSLANERDVYLQMMLADLYIADTQYTPAKTIYDSLPQLTHEIQEITILRELTCTFKQNGWTWMDLANDSSGAYSYNSVINSIAHADTSIAAMQAQAIRYLAFGDTILKVIEFKEGDGTGKWGGAPKITGIQTTEVNQFTVYPNPAGNQLVVEYSFADNINQNNEFVMYDMLGNQLLTQPLAGKTGSEILDISSLTNGLYIYEVRHQATMVKTGKLSVIK